MERRKRTASAGRGGEQGPTKFVCFNKTDVGGETSTTQWAWKEDTLPIEIVQLILAPFNTEIRSNHMGDVRVMGAVCRSVCRWWRALLPYWIHRYDIWGHLVERGWLSLLQWAIEGVHRLPPVGELPADEQRLSSCNSSLFAVASWEGQLGILKWLRGRMGWLSDKDMELAAQAGHLEVVKWMVEQRECKGGWEYGTINAAAYGGHLEVLQWMKAQGHACDDAVIRDAALHSAFGGHERVLEWLHKNGFPVTKHLVASAAAWGGHFELAKQLAGDEQKGLFPLIDPVRAAVAAAGSGNVAMLKWLRHLDPSLELNEDSSLEERMLEAASMGGHVEMVKYLHEIGYEDHVLVINTAAQWGCLGVLQLFDQEFADWDCFPFDNAVCAGHHQVVKWLWENNIDAPADLTLDVYRAAERGHLKILKWLLKRDAAPSLSVRLFQNAAVRSDLYLMQWLWKKGCPWDESVCSSAVSHFGALQWLRARGCPWDETTCAAAARMGTLKTLQWVRERGCPWDETTCAAAARMRRLKTLQWVRERGCPWSDSVFVKAIKQLWEPMEVVEWLILNECPWSAKVCRMAARTRNIEVLARLRECGCPWDESAYQAAARRGHKDVIRWLREHGCPGVPAEDGKEDDEPRFYTA